MMYKRFTEDVRKILQLANQEAQLLGQDFISSEAILLGLSRFDCGGAAIVLKNLQVDRKEIRPAVTRLGTEGPQSTSGKLPFNTEAKQVIEQAMACARELSHDYVGSEHVLIALLREQKLAAARALASLGVTLETAQAEVLKIQGQSDTSN